MAQLSLRLDDGLHRRARLAAEASGMSLNSFIARVLSVATDPASTEPEADRIRARLAAAGLIDSPDFTGTAPTPAQDDELQAVRARTRGGTPGSVLITEDRASRP